MTVSVFNVCDTCGARASAEESRGWRLRQQPTRTTCRECLAKECQYDEDYFLRGKESGKSLYSDYRWLPELTIPMVCAMIRHLGIGPDDTVLDFGCARGYVVKAFQELGYIAYGYDTSEWAVQNADPAV